MSSSVAMSVMSGIEFLLSATLGYLFWKKGLHRRFPAMGGYLALRVTSTPVLFVLLSESMTPNSQSWYIAYFIVYWAVYIVSAVLLFFICMEVFRAALGGFQGLMRLGIVVFRWAFLVSLVFTLLSLFLDHRATLPNVGIAIVRSVSIIELCLLGFLCIAMNALQLSPRDLPFGIALGFGLMSANDFILTALTAHYAALTAPLQFVYQAIILAGLATWIVYCVLPERARQPIVVAASSTIYRWNEIASALGHSGTKVAVQQPAGSFFLTDVEKVVEKVLTRNLKESETNL